LRRAGLHRFWFCDRGVVLGDETVDERDEGFAGAGEDEVVISGVPVELEAGGEGGDPDLADWGVGGNDEAGAGRVEEDIESAVLLLDFKGGLLVFLAGDEMTLEAEESGFCCATEGLFVLHGHSVARRRCIRQATS